VIKADGGTVEKVDLWGKRRFAYEINHKNDGYYAVIEVMSTPEAVAELDRQLSLNEAVVRTKVIRPNWSIQVKAS
jgi:small subunit ribosomal protein S6